MHKKKKIGIMYSTDSNFEYKYEKEEKTLNPEQQNLEVYIERKNRNGKTATIIRGFVGLKSDLKELSKKLKTKCGVGGSVKNGEMIIQGNFRNKIITILENENYNCKRIGN